MTVICQGLTSNESKIKLFEDDMYFNISLEIADNILGDKLVNTLKRFALVILKPESFMHQKHLKALDLIREEGFRPVYYKFKKITRVECLELWRYQWSAASFMRQLASEKLMSHSESMLILFEAPTSIAAPASTYLSLLKGPAVESKRKNFHFRTKLKPVNRMLNYLHISDEPADIIRELGILFEWDEQMEIYKSLAKGEQVSYEKLLLSFPHVKESESVTTSSPKDLLHQLKNQVQDKAENPRLKNTCLRIIYQIEGASERKENLGFQFFKDLQEIELAEWTWSLLVIATTYIEHESGNDKVLELNLFADEN